jgi:hypothetical protein
MYERAVLGAERRDFSSERNAAFSEGAFIGSFA